MSEELRERVEALAEALPARTRAWLRAGGLGEPEHLFVPTVELRALLAESTPAPAPAADGGEVVSVAIKAQNPDLETAWETIAWWERTCAYWQEQAQAGYRLRDSLPARDADIRRTARAEALREAAGAADKTDQREFIPAGAVGAWLRARATGGTP